MDPRAHGARPLGLLFPACDLVAVTTRPNNGRVGRIRQGETGFATAHTPLPAGVYSAAILEWWSNARAPHVRAVLHIGVDVVRDLIVYGDVIHLANRQLHPLEAAAVNRCDI